MFDLQPPDSSRLRPKRAS